jgi:thioredoxin-dependent peroxiredoxin
VQIVRRPPTVGKEQQAEPHLRDKQRLDEGEAVPEEPTRVPVPEERNCAPNRRCCGGDEDEKPDDLVRAKHRRKDRLAAMVTEGQEAPDFELTSDSGERVRLSQFRGRPVVLYFYPKDDTPGCTAQACGIRDTFEDFEQSGAVVLGVSPDEESSHVKFKQKYGLPFTLLADPEHEVADEYGVWGERKYMGKTYWGVERSTFLIDENGRVSKVMRRVKPDTHADQVLAALAA